MRKELVLSLNSRAAEVAKSMSDPNREFNFARELFCVESVRPLSESVGIVQFVKQPSNKRALAVFFCINGGDGFWLHFFPTDSHILGMQYIPELLRETEEFNFDKNGS